MAIAFGAAGTAASTATRTTSPTYPTVASGDYMLIAIAQKYGRTPATPSGWTALGSATGGAGTDGVGDEGNVTITVYGKESDGTESGTQNVLDSGGTANCSGGRIFTFTKAGGTTWSVVGGAVASDNTAGTDLVWTYDTDPGVTANDYLVTVWAINSDAYTHTHALTCSGLSSITTQSRGNSAVTVGMNLRYGLVSHAIGAGTSSGVATYTNTSSGSATNAPAGGSVLIRLREVSAGGTVVPLFMHNYRQRRSA